MRLMGSRHAPLSPARSDRQIHSSNIQMVLFAWSEELSKPSPNLPIAKLVIIPLQTLPSPSLTFSHPGRMQGAGFQQCGLMLSVLAGRSLYTNCQKPQCPMLSHLPGWRKRIYASRIGSVIVLDTPTSFSFLTWAPSISSLPVKQADAMLTRSYSAITKLCSASTSTTFWMLLRRRSHC